MFKLIIFVFALAAVSGSTDLCNVCKEASRDLEGAIHNSKIQKKAFFQLEKVCGLLPEDSKQHCQSVVSGLASKVMPFLLEDFEPENICTVMRVCGSQQQGEMNEVHQLSQKSVLAGPACELCQLLVNTVDNYLKDNKSEAAINSTVYKICNDLPSSIKDVCLVYAPNLINELFVNGFNASIVCAKVHMCTQQENFKPQKRSLPAGPLCELCETIVNTVDTYLQDNTTDAAINSTVYKICNSLPETFKQLCLSYAPSLIDQLITNGFNASVVCAKVNLCITQGQILPAKRDLIDILDSSVKAGPACQLCELLVNTIDDYLKDNTTDAAINATVYKICNDLPGPLKDLCLSNAPALINEIIANGFNASVVCAKVRMCSSDKAMPIKRNIFNVVEQTVKAGPACELCQILVNTVDTYLKDNATDAAINSTVYKICNDLPGSIKDLCLSYAPSLINEIIANGFNASVVCAKVHMCTSDESTLTKKSILDMVEQTTRAGPACELCQILVNTVDTYLKDNATDAAINSTVYKICNDLPGSIKDLCLSYAPSLINEIIANGFNASVVCAKVHMCTSDKSAPSKKSIFNIVEQTARAGPACELCQILINTVDNYLKDNATDAAINSTVYKVCNDLPGSIKDLCLSYAPSLVDELIKNGFNASVVCAKVRMCTSAPNFMNNILSSVLKAKRSETGDKVDWCTICTDHVSILDRDLYREEDTVQDFLDEVCKRLPPPTNTACQNAMDAKFPAMWLELLKGPASAKNVCTMLTACPK